jgi:phosphate acyltransferase
VRRDPGLEAVLVGLPEEIGPLLEHRSTGLQADLGAAASQVVAMDEPPADALRRKRDSSMRVAMNLVHEGRPPPASAPATPAR